MIKHEDILKLRFVRFPDGQIVSIDKVNKTGELVFEKESVHPEMYDLLRAAPLLYQILNNQQKGIEGLIEAAEAVGAHGIVPTLRELKKPIEIALAMAQFGLEIYAAPEREG